MKNIITKGILTVAVSMLALSCSSDDDSQSFVLTPYNLDIGNRPNPNIPDDNELTEQGVALGRKLFYEKALSQDGTMACASCHKQENAFTDTNKFSIGVKGLPGKRQAMAIFNMAWNDNAFFWDGRAELLRDQALMPIEDHLEMNETLDNVVEKLQNIPSYSDDFYNAFESNEITPYKISLALEQFMNSIISLDSKYDRYLKNEIELTDSEERGRKLFFTDYNKFFPDVSGADCAHCHSGFNFENDRYMNNGLDNLANQSDIGYESVTLNTNDKAKFKVTSLRNIAITQPYMHDGRFNTLEEVIDHYNETVMQSPTLNPAISDTREKGLFLDDEKKADLIAFLKTLTDNDLLSNPKYSNPF